MLGCHRNVSVPEEELDVNHGRSYLLYHVCDEVEFVAGTGRMGYTYTGGKNTAFEWHV